MNPHTDPAQIADYERHAEECEVPFCGVCWGQILDQYEEGSDG